MNQELLAALAELKQKMDSQNAVQIAALEKKNADALASLETKADNAAKLSETKNAEQVNALKNDIRVVQDHADKIEMKAATAAGAQKTETLEGAIRETLLRATDEIAKFARKEKKGFVLDMKAVGDMGTGNVTGGSRYGAAFSPSIVMQPARALHLAQLLPGGSIDNSNTFTFMRENGLGEGGFAPVAEGALKPQIDLDLVEATVNVETIAGWARVTRKAMTNIPGFVAFLTARLPELFEQAKDQQILYGTGVTPQLKGILTTGNFVASVVPAATPLVEKIIRDIARLEDAFSRIANGVVLRPADYYGLFLNKAGGSGEYDLPQGVTFVGGQMYILGIPVYRTTALLANDYIVGDWMMGAQLLTQEAMRIEFFEQDGINVRENKVTVRVEGNYALPVYGPDFFIKGTSALV